MSETMKTIRTRRSIRKFQDKMPERELIDRVIEAGTYAAQEWAGSHRSL